MPVWVESGAAQNRRHLQNCFNLTILLPKLRGQYKFQLLRLSYGPFLSVVMGPDITNGDVSAPSDGGIGTDGRRDSGSDTGIAVALDASGSPHEAVDAAASLDSGERANFRAGELDGMVAQTLHVPGEVSRFRLGGRHSK